MAIENKEAPAPQAWKRLAQLTQLRDEAKARYDAIEKQLESLRAERDKAGLAFGVADTALARAVADAFGIRDRVCGI